MAQKSYIRVVQKLFSQTSRFVSLPPKSDGAYESGFLLIFLLFCTTISLCHENFFIAQNACMDAVKRTFLHDCTWWFARVSALESFYSA